MRQVSLVRGGWGVSEEGASTPLCVTEGMKEVQSAAVERSCEGQVAKGMESVMMCVGGL